MEKNNQLEISDSPNEQRNVNIVQGEQPKSKKCTKRKIAIIVTLSVVLKYMNDKKKYINISIIGSFILLAIPFIFRLFIRRIYYGNSYYTSFIKSIIDTNLVMYALIGIIIIIGLLIKEKFSKK
jgi:hypothetical protein